MDPNSQPEMGNWGEIPPWDGIPIPKVSKATLGLLEDVPAHDRNIFKVHPTQTIPKFGIFSLLFKDLWDFLEQTHKTEAGQPHQGRIIKMMLIYIKKI